MYMYIYIYMCVCVRVYVFKKIIKKIWKYMPRITMNACSFIQLCLSQLRVSCCMFLPRNLKVSGSRLCGEIERRTVYRRFLQEKTIHSNKHAAKWLKMICLKHFWADSTSSCLQLSLLLERTILHVHILKQKLWTGESMQLSTESTDPLCPSWNRAEFFRASSLSPSWFTLLS